MTQPMTDQSSAQTADNTFDDEHTATQNRTIDKKKLKKFLLIGGVTLVVGAVAAIVVAKTRGSSLPEIASIIPE